MATAEKRVVTEATGQAMLAELRKIPGVMNPVPVEKGGTGVTTPEEILELIGAQPKLPINVVEELGATVKSVNQVTPDEHGNVQLLHVAVADNLSSDEATVVNGTFIERTTGGDASIQDGSANLGVLYGYSVRQGYSAESHSMQVIPVGRLDDSVIISAEINWDTYRTAVNNVSTNKTFTYGVNGWNENPATYGIEITGTPASGDVINVYFTAENRGIIVNTTPETFVETNWNLYDPTTGICRVLKYSDEYGFKIGGSYTGVSFATTRDAEQKTVITPDSDGLFDIPEDGYLFVTGGNDTDTYILMTWSDWGDGYTGDFEVHSESVVDFSELMSNTFPFGMCAIGIVMDEINFSDKVAYVRIERVAYTTEARIAAENSGRAYSFDDEWIYQVKETPERVRFNIDNSMVVYDHGTEYFTGTTLPVTVYQLFGQNLKDKLRREVVAVTPQNFSVAQKRIARENIEAAWDPEVIKTINHKTPDQYGDITIVEGTANASYGLYRINTVIQPAAWSLVNGAYQVAYADNLIKADMDGMETWLDDPSVMLGKTRFTTIDGALIISTAVQPVAAWSLHVALGTNGSTVLEQVYNKAEENTVALVEHDDTAFHSIAAGQYVLWKSALYKATSAITAGDTLASSGNGANLSAISDGVANELISFINPLKKSTMVNDALAAAVSLAADTIRIYTGSGDSYTGSVPDRYYKYGVFYVVKRSTYASVIAMSEQNKFATNYYNGSAWLGWRTYASDADIEQTLAYMQLVNGGGTAGNVTVALERCSGTVHVNGIGCRYNSKYVLIQGTVRINGLTRNSANPGVSLTFPVAIDGSNLESALQITTLPIGEMTVLSGLDNGGKTAHVQVSESFQNYDQSSRLVLVCHPIIVRRT